MLLKPLLVGRPGCFEFYETGLTLGTDSESEYTPSSSTDSPESWRLIGQWLKHCTENHDRCNARVAEPWAPTRLLDISTFQDGYVRLVEQDRTISMTEPYATLSHCWGTGFSIQSTNSLNIHMHFQRISNAYLPKTFLDAIRISQSLSLRYLWIDSLCIIQDSIDDWTQEADIMSKVYRYAFINIAATGAKDGTVGCFWERDPRAVRPTEFTIHWSNCEENEGRRYHVVPEPHLWAQGLVAQPLNQRGWVLQERILSPRVLHFGSDQLLWECREFVACETYHRGLPPSLRGNVIIDIKTLDLGDEPRDDRWPAKYISTSVNRSVGLLGRVGDALTELFRPITLQEVTLNSTRQTALAYRDWDAVVELYSMANLTFPIDKLTALSGIASSISIGDKTAVADGYLAGLWQSSLPSHLLWTTERRERVRVDVPRRHWDYIAPSWSWASIDGKISMAWCLHNYDPRDYLVTLEGASMTWYSTAARFGRVTAGFLVLSGPLASVLWEADESPTSMNARTAKITHICPKGHDHAKSVSIPPDTTTKAEILFDTVEDQVPEELILLPVVGIMRRTVRENQTVSGLVLRQEAPQPYSDLEQNRTERYSRLGFFYTVRPRASRILRNIPRQTITII